MFDIIKEILISEKEFTKTKYKRLKKAIAYIKNNLTDSDSNIYLTLDSFMEINNPITGWNNADKYLIANKLYQIINQFNEKKITSVKFYSILLNKIHPFYDGNGSTCQILFDNEKLVFGEYNHVSGMWSITIHMYTVFCDLYTL